MSHAQVLRIAIIAGEHSGDALGASLVDALRRRGLTVQVSGVGEEKLSAAGQASYFPQSDIAVMGFSAVAQRLPLLMRRIRETADRLITENPDMIVTIDSPDFNFRVARKVRARAPHIPIMHWVCPSVWAWRPGRAKKMRGFIDHVMCLLPFEPDALRDLDGPPGTYVGHPLIEQAAAFRPRNEAERTARHNTISPNILLLPGSRRSIATRLMPIFAEVAAGIRAQIPAAQFNLPTVPSVRPIIADHFSARQVPVAVVEGEEEKRAAMRSARAALAASGTVTLELALAHTPMVAAYRVAEWEAMIARRVIRVSSVLLPNLVLGHNAVPEFLQEHCTANNLQAALLPLIAETPVRQAQLAAFGDLDKKMSMGDRLPSDVAAQTVLDTLARKRRA